MAFCGIICEYNPLHLGHIYHLRKTREIIKNLRGIICVMSGNFTQRGEAAIADKYSRARWAIKAGADIVLELPSVFAAAPAKDFAFGGVRLLSKIKDVKYISFGSEYGDIEKVKELAGKLNTADIKRQLGKGSSFASAFGEIDGYSSNNILGAEYIGALNKLESGIIPVTVKREGAGYNDTALSGKFASATAIRNLLSNNNLTAAKDYLPPYVYEDLENFQGNGRALFDMVVYKILSLGAANIEKYAYISEGLHNRIYAAAQSSASLDELLNNIATKRYPEAKIKRILIALLLDITRKKAESAKKKRRLREGVGGEKGKRYAFKNKRC